MVGPPEVHGRWSFIISARHGRCSGAKCTSAASRRPGRSERAAESVITTTATLPGSKCELRSVAGAVIGDAAGFSQILSSSAATIVETDLTSAARASPVITDTVSTCGTARHSGRISTPLHTSARRLITCQPTAGRLASRLRELRDGCSTAPRPETPRRRNRRTVGRRTTNARDQWGPSSSAGRLSSRKRWRGATAVINSRGPAARTAIGDVAQVALESGSLVGVSSLSAPVWVPDAQRRLPALPSSKALRAAPSIRRSLPRTTRQWHRGSVRGS